MKPWPEMSDSEKARFVELYGLEAAISAMEWRPLEYEPPPPVRLRDGTTWTPVYSSEQLSICEGQLGGRLRQD